MRILADNLLKDHYDVIVVGAGLGGLTAGSLLAKRGLSVLIIEQQNKPGGACTSFKHEDHVYDVGAAMLYGFGENGFRPFRTTVKRCQTQVSQDVLYNSAQIRECVVINRQMVSR